MASGSGCCICGVAGNYGPGRECPLCRAIRNIDVEKSDQQATLAIRAVRAVWNAMLPGSVPNTVPAGALARMKQPASRSTWAPLIQAALASRPPDAPPSMDELLILMQVPRAERTTGTRKHIAEVCRTLGIQLSRRPLAPTAPRDVERVRDLVAADPEAPWFRASDIAARCRGVADRRNIDWAGKCLAEIGLVARRPRIDGKPVRVYMRRESILEHALQDVGTPVRVAELVRAAGLLSSPGIDEFTNRFLVERGYRYREVPSESGKRMAEYIAPQKGEG